MNMRIHSLRPNFVLAAACLLALLLFALDSVLSQAHLWGSFLLPIVVAFLWGRRRDIFIVTAFASVLVVAEYRLEQSGAQGEPLLNHLLPLAVLWAAAWLLAQRQQLQMQLVRSEQNLEQQVNVRTAALAAREEQLARIFRANPGGIAITRQSDGCCLEVNDAYLATVGYTRDQLIGRSLIDLGILSAESRAKVRAAFHAQGYLRGFDLQLTSAQGEPVDILYSLEQIAYDGEPCYLGLIVDVTERKRLEMRASRLAAIVEASHEAIISADLGGTVVSVNRSAEKLYGIAAGEAVGRSIVDIALPQNTTGFQEMLGRVGAGEVVSVDDAAWQLPDGTTKSLSVSVSPIRNDAGEVIAFAALARDITARRQMEAALRKSEELYRTLVNNAAEGIFSVDGTGCYLEVNDRYCQMVGRTRAEIIGTHLNDITVDVTPEFFAAVGAELAQRGSSTFERRLRHKNGTFPEVEVTVAPLSGGRRVGIVHDISQRKADERALRASEARFATLFSSSPVGITLVRLADGRFQEVNAAFAAMVGWSREEIIGRSSLELGFVSPDDLARRTGVLQAKGSMHGEDLVLRTKHGEQLYTVLAVETVDFEGEPYLLSSIVDITERKRLEEQLREAYQRVRLAADAADIGIWNWNFADADLEWDERMYDLYAVTAEERRRGVSYDLWRSRLHPDDLALVEPAQNDVRRSGGQWSGTYRIVLPGGAVRYIQASLVAELEPGGKPWHMIGINRDVTDQKLYEQLLQDTNAVLEQRVADRTADLQSALAELQRANQLKDEFMAMISHELRTPLTGVLSMSEILADQVAGPLNDRQAFYVKGITESGVRLLNVINGILGYTYLLSGKVRLGAEPCELAYLLGVCAASQQHKAAAKKQSVTVQVTPPDLAITSDGTALAEVLKRLLDNAAKFTPVGGEFGLEAHLGNTPGTVDLVVWDTGIGIAPDRLDHILGPFTQADASLARDHEGLGLGLAYVYQMVRLLGGTLAIESSLGIGSRFTITLPA